MAVAERTTVAIGLDAACDFPSCAVLAFPLHKTLAGGGYDVCSILTIPASIEEWRAGHRTARKRADRAKRLGYEARHVIRHEHVDEVFAVNTSAAERQGRRMSDGYWERPSEAPLPDYPCRLHAIHCYGAFAPGGALVAYLWMYRAGELALVSSILGHADHLGKDVMYALFEFALAAEVKVGPGVVVYNRHDSGTDGLRYFKERLGFEETRVEWSL